MCACLLVEISISTKLMPHFTVKKRIWKCMQFSWKLKHPTVLSFHRAPLGHITKFIKSSDGTLKCLYNP